MSIISSVGSVRTVLPYIRQVAATPTSNVTLNATGETLHCTGRVYLQNSLGGSKTLSAAGGGAIVWLAGTVTFSNGSSVFDLGVQDVSTASSPAQGDGTFDVKASFTGGGGGITTAAVNTSVMTTGTKTIAHGDLISITFGFTTKAGADSVVVSTALVGAEGGSYAYGAALSENTTGSFAALATFPNCFIKFDDGSVGYIMPMCFIAATGNSAFNVDTGTADEYGTIINVPFTFKAEGIQAAMNFAGNSSDCELILYSDPFGTPVAERTVTIDATQIAQAAAARNVTAIFSSPYLMKANTAYAVTVRPTTTNNVTLYYEDGNTDSKLVHPPNKHSYAVRRLDNTGAFADTNSGTEKTRLYRVSVIGYSVEQGINNANYRIGI